MPIEIDNTNIIINDGITSNVYEVVKSKGEKYSNDYNYSPQPITLDETIKPQIPADKYQYITLTYENAHPYYNSTSNGKQRIHTINFPEDVVADILIVGGGGGGGKTDAGGGGGGGVIYEKDLILNGTYTIKVGRGGLGGKNPSNYNVGLPGSKGKNSQIIGGNIVINKEAIGGGGGGSGHPSDVEPIEGGGSSGGLGTSDTIRNTNNYHIEGQGYSGGIGHSSYGGGGGGGAGGPGLDGSSTIPASGGRGREINITGTPIFYAGGGGGGHCYINSTWINTSGGLGGGGSGTGLGDGLNATYYGGGGGGGGGNWGNGGDGYSGIVIIRYYYVSSITHKYLAFTYNPYPVLTADSTNLVAWYKFDGNFNDSSGNSHHLTAVNTTISSTNSLINDSANFSGQDDYLEFPSSINPYTIWNGNGISFTMWVKITSSGIWSRFIDFQSIIPSNSGLLIAKKDTSNNIRIQVNNTQNDFTPSVNVFDGNWHHLVFTCSSSGVWSAYVDGTNQNISYTQNIPNLTYVARYINKSTYSSDGKFDGLMDGFRIYNKSLSQTEVSTLYTNINIPTTYQVNFPVNTTCDILIVGGGGGGGAGHGGGGGAGQLVYINQATLNGTYNVNVGKGGIGGISTEVSGTRQATKGINSSFDIVIAEGGGANTNTLSDKNGGSGAGGDGYTPDGGTEGKGLKNANVDTFSSGSVYAFGNDGGIQSDTTKRIAGGGGGAGAPGLDGTSYGYGGVGLSGISSLSIDFKTHFGLPTNDTIGDYDSISNKVYFAGGGGGGQTPISDNSSLGGGGKGGSSTIPTTNPGFNGLANSGGGGGGGSGGAGQGGDGGSGIVIIRFPYIRNYDLISYDAQWTYNSENTSVYHLGNVGININADTSNSLTIAGDVNINGDIYINNAKFNYSNTIIENEQVFISYDYIEKLTGMNGWTKIKHKPSGVSSYYPGHTFDAGGTIDGSQVIGNPNDNTQHWSIPFDQANAKYFLFHIKHSDFNSKYEDRWIVIERSEIIRTSDYAGTYGYNSGYIHYYKSNLNPNGFTEKSSTNYSGNAIDQALYNRTNSTYPDPQISTYMTTKNGTTYAPWSTTPEGYQVKEVYTEAYDTSMNLEEGGVYVKYTDDIPITIPQPQIPLNNYQYITLTFENAHPNYTSTTDGNQRTHIINFPENVVADILIVGGGGGGGSHGGGNYECGGGGAGAFQYINNVMLYGVYNIIVGNGGSPSGKGYSSQIKYSNNILYNCEGGGAGGGSNGILNANNNGGSGGGGQFGYNNFGIANERLKGFNGAKGTTNSGINEGGGGGGAGGSAILKFGGIGKICDILGNNNYYAGGGGGCTYSSIRGDGGLGGGGKGSTSSLQAENGLNGTGGGGGGGYLVGNKPGGSGGSGIVIIRYYVASSITHKYLTLNYTPLSNLVYDFTPYNDFTSWTNYATQIGATWDLELWYSTIGVFKGGFGYIQLRLPNDYDNIKINYANPHTTDYTYIYIDTLQNLPTTVPTDNYKDRAAPYESRTYSTSYTFGQYLKIVEYDNAVIGGDLIITFSKSQTKYTLNVLEDTTCDILVVGGGGAGGNSMGGGGGAGGVVYTINQTLNAGTYTIGVGKGGLGISLAQDYGTGQGTIGADQDGKDSFIKDTNGNYVSLNMGGTNQNLRAYGGGGGGIYFNPVYVNGRDGGSGGGCSESNNNNWVVNTAGSALQGNTYWNGITYVAGGKSGRQNTTQYQDYNAGGGGGAGSNGNVYKDGNNGVSINITGSQKYYAAGGGAGQYSINYSTNEGIGGSGIGGNGRIYSGTSYLREATSGTNGTGSGGGGGSYTQDPDNPAGSGGSGIVIIRYKINNYKLKGLSWNYSNQYDDVYYMNKVSINKYNATSQLDINGDIVGTSKSFKIVHPISKNIYLYHACIEGPRFDNIYRGKKLVINGYCEVDIDSDCNSTGGMTPGTFVALNDNCQLYLQNNQTFDKVRGYIENGIIKIYCINTTENIMVDWLVIGERKDNDVIKSSFTNASGKLICEH